MQRTVTTLDFLSELLSELGAIPRDALIWFASLGALSGALSLVSWLHRPQIALIICLGVTIALSSLVATYSSAMKMIGFRSSYRNLVRFTVTTLAMMAPIGLAFFFIIMARSDDAWVVPAIVSTLMALAFVTWLPGWPILQATSRYLVDPWTAFKLTKGLRLPLVMTGMLMSGLNKAAPSTSTAESLTSAIILAALNGASYTCSLMLAVAIAVSAWKHMTSEQFVPA